MTATLEERYRRDLDPVMWRARQLGQELRDYPYEKVDARQYVQLGKVVREIEKFLGRENAKKGNKE